MRVSLDATAVPARPGGAGRYTIELARALAGRGAVELTVMCRRDDADRWAAVGGARGADRVVARAPTPRPLRLAWEQLGLPRELRHAGVEVHHGPHYTMPHRSPVPVVVSVHDCTFFDHPEWHLPTKAPFFRRAIRTSARRAAAIVCGSHTTAARLRAVCDVRAEIFVAPYGVDTEQFRPDEAEPGADDAALSALGLQGSRFIAFVGTIEPRKGVAGLVRAFDRVAGDHPDALLVLAGQMGWKPGDVERALDEAAHPGQVRRLGFVPEAALSALLRRAAAVAYPSMEEGGGLPALEALACGAPLITTAGTVMEETAAGAAVLVAPGDVAALATALTDALRGTDPAAAERRMRGLAVASTRTWAAAAEVHLAAYRHAASVGGALR